MLLKKFVGFLLMLTFYQSFSQNSNFSVSSIPPELLQNANAVVRNYDLIVELNDYNNMTVKRKRVVTILNENGLRHLDATIPYNPSIKVKSVQAFIYDSQGQQIRKFKNKDFKDYSQSGNDLYSEDRITVIDYTPTGYPFTFVIEVETQSSSTVNLYSWYPMQGYYCSTEKASYKIINTKNIELKVKDFNLKTHDVKNLSEGTILHYTVKNIPAYQWEYMSPQWDDFGPVVKISPKKFRLRKVDGYAESWNDFGKWSYEKLYADRNDLPEATINEVAKLIENIEEPIEKAKIIYQYVQDKTRYISVQLGIGGWQPMLASHVDEVSYGDCKGLTNYTLALMKSQGIEAYHTILYGGRDVKNIDSDFVSLQGNHMILNLPNDGNPLWLECTDQKVPFGFIANFTDDRDVLVVTPEGGRIEHTKVYTSKENYLNSIAEISFEGTGFTAKINTTSGGTQYYDRLRRVIDHDHKERNEHYKEYWDHINGLSLDKISIQNDKKTIEIEEAISVKAPNYAMTAGEKILLNPNAFNRLTTAPPRYTDRKLPFVIDRGFYDTDEYNIKLPEGYKLDNEMEPQEIISEFGIYKASLEVIDPTMVKYKRTFEIKKGSFSNDAYKNYRNFIRKVIKADKSAIALSKSN